MMPRAQRSVEAGPSPAADNASGASWDDPPPRDGRTSLKWHGTAPGGVAMGLADLDFLPPPVVQRRLAVWATTAVLGYPPPAAALDCAYLDWLSRRHGVRPPARALLPCGGVMAAMRCLIEEVTGPGEAVVVPVPTYPAILSAVVQAERRLMPVPLLCSAEGGWTLDLDRLRATLVASGARLCILPSPHNPTGRIWSAAELTALAGVCAAAGAVLCLDEVFIDWAIGGRRASTGLAVAAVTQVPSVVLQAATKTFNIPGLRGGHAIVHDDSLRARIAARLVRHGADQLNLAYLEAAAAAYGGGASWLARARAYVAANLRIACQTIAAAAGRPLGRMPDATYLLWLDVGAIGLRSDALVEALRPALTLLAEAPFGSVLNRHVRINVGTSRLRLIAGLRPLCNHLSQERRS